MQFAVDRSRLAACVLGSFAGAIPITGPSNAWAQALADVPRLQGGRWVRIASLEDAEGRSQARQEHSAVTPAASRRPSRALAVSPR